MASSQPWPFDDEDRPSGSAQPLNQADLQAILAHLNNNDPDELLAGTGADRPVVALRVRPAWADRAARPRRPGGGCELPSGPCGFGPCPGGSLSSLGSVSVGESLAAS
jgi:hypothetical protein